MIRIKNPQVTFAGIVDRLSWHIPTTHCRPRTISSSGCALCYRKCRGVRSKGRARVDLAPTRRAPQNPCAYRLIPLPDKSEWLVRVRTRLKVPPAPLPLDLGWPNRIPSAPQSADHWIKPLPMRRPSQDSFSDPVPTTPRQPTCCPPLLRLRPPRGFSGAAAMCSALYRESDKSRSAVTRLSQIQPPVSGLPHCFVVSELQLLGFRSCGQVHHKKLPHD